MLIGTVWLVLFGREAGTVSASEKVAPLKVTPVKLASPEKLKPPARPAPRRPRPTPVERVAVAPPPRPAPVARPAPPNPPRQTVNLAPSYPRAAATANRPRPRPQRPVSSASQRRGALFPAAESPTPGPSPSVSPAPLPRTASPPASQPAARPGDADKTGNVVPARPVGRLRLNVPAWNALKRGTIEARFEVAADGKTVVTLLRKTGSQEVDKQALEFLKTVKWMPKTVSGVPVPDVTTVTFDRES